MMRRTAITRRGFTLIELLVVIGLTALLLAMLLSPLSRALGLVARTQSQVDAQDAVRNVGRKIREELRLAMWVGDPRPLTLWVPGFVLDKEDQPEVQPASQPRAFVVDNGMLVFALPKRRFYCTLFDHFLVEPNPNQGAPGNVDPVSPIVAIDTCPRENPPGVRIHPNSPVELRPLQPLESEAFWRQDPSNGNWFQEKVWVVYFVGLKEPGFPVDPQFATPTYADSPPPGLNPAGLPQYHNPEFFRAGVGAFSNLYVLYRAEFDPDPTTLTGAATLNWLTGGAPNPNFFYDGALAANGRSFRNNWKIRAVAQLPMEHTDLLRWAKDGNFGYRPELLTTFEPAPIESETAQPNRPAGPIGGPPLSATELRAQEWTAEFGHWVGADPGLGEPLPTNILSMPQPGPPGWLRGARVQVYQRAGGGEALVFDSATGLRGRLVSWDVNRGIVGMAIPRRADVAGPNGSPSDVYNATVAIDPVNLIPFVELGLDNVGRTVSVSGLAGGVPGSLGEARAVFPIVRVVPGSEEIVLMLNSGAGPSQPLRRAGWTGLGEGQDRLIAPIDLGGDEYSINYETGDITLSPSNPMWMPGVVSPGGSQELWVRYQFQTTGPTGTVDVVKVSYSTKEMIDLNIGLLRYGTRDRHAYPVQVKDRVRVKNLIR